MASVNKVILVGNLGSDPELRRTQSGTAVVSFSIATSEKWTDKNGQQNEDTEWHNITAWNKQAEILAQYLQKGSSVYIEGKLKTSSWDDNGVKKYKTDIIVREFQFLGGSKQQTQQQQNKQDFAPQDNGFQQQGFQQQEPQQQYNNFGNPPF